MLFQRRRPWPSGQEADGSAPWRLQAPSRPVFCSARACWARSGVRCVRSRPEVLNEILISCSGARRTLSAGSALPEDSGPCLPRAHRGTETRLLKKPSPTAMPFQGWFRTRLRLRDASSEHRTPAPAMVWLLSPQSARARAPPEPPRVPLTPDSPAKELGGPGSPRGAWVPTRGAPEPGFGGCLFSLLPLGWLKPIEQL